MLTFMYTLHAYVCISALTLVFSVCNHIFNVNCLVDPEKDGNKQNKDEQTKTGMLVLVCVIIFVKCKLSSK